MHKAWPLLLLAIAASWTGVLYPYHHDEGVFLTIGREVSLGKVPYKDVFDHKPPGIYFWWAGFMQLFGHGTWWPRAVMIVVNGAGAILVFFLGKKVVPKYWAVLGAAGYLILGITYQGQFGLTEPFVALWSLGSLVCLSLFFSRRQAGYLWLAGLTAGLACLFKQSGLTTGAALVSSILLSAGMRAATLAAAGMGIPVLITAIYLAGHQSLMAAWQAVVWFNLTAYRPAGVDEMLMALPLFLVPVISVGMALPAGIRVWRKTKPVESVFMLVCLGLNIPFILFRPYHHYWLPLLPFLILLALPGFINRPKTGWLYRFTLFSVSLGCIVYAVTTAWPQHTQQTRELSNQGCGTQGEPIRYYINHCPVPFMIAAPVEIVSD